MSAPPHRHTVDVDVDVRGAGRHAVVRLVADVVAPARGATRGPVFVCWPGGGMARGYWDLQVAGEGDERGFSMAAHLADRGFVSILVDHLGAGESSPPPDATGWTSEEVADADAAAAAALLARVRAGTLAPGLDAIPDARPVGVGHSMGALFTVWQQARQRPYDGLVLLGYGVDGVQLDHAMAYVEEARANRLAFATDEEIAGSGTSASDLLLAGMPVPAAAIAALRTTSSPMVPTDGIDRLRRGAPELAAIDVPVLVANGGRDITGDIGAVLDGFPSSTDRTVFELAGSGHNHNVAPNRHELWDEIASWAAARF
jgi:alpha-beta hydrolase superfamily lysophospholipase